MQYYHVITCSSKGKTIWQDDEDCISHLRFVKEACVKYHLACLAYAIMPDHVHLILSCEETCEKQNLTKARYKISSGYAVHVRRKYSALFAEGDRIFRSHSTTKWLQTTYDLKNVIRYVHLNPIRKHLETTLGESIRSSYSALLAARNPGDESNPFNYFQELREIRDMLNAEDVYRVFGRNHAGQGQAFAAFHTDFTPEKTGEPLYLQENLKFQAAEEILKEAFFRRYSHGEKIFNAGNRTTYLAWLNRRGNPNKEVLICRIARETHLCARDIADFLKIGVTTVRNVLRKNSEKNSAE